MPDYEKPIPVPDERSAPFWEAARSHTLAFQRCQLCGHFSHPPEVLCGRCGALEPSFAWEPVSGRGTIRSWVVMHDCFVPGFENDAPWVNALVELDAEEGLLFLASLVDGPGKRVATGAPVTVTFRDVTASVSLPFFRLARAGEREE